jgi:Cys-tRNA(Pro) deacylase
MGYMELEARLKAEGVWYRFLEKPDTVHTADASRATGIDLHKITKNLVCRTSDGRHALLVIAGDRRVNLQRAAQALNVRNVQLVGFNEAETVSGYPPGGTPSVFHKTPLTVIIDAPLLAYETIFCGGGTTSRLLELRIKDVLRIGEGITASISE